MIDSFDLEIVAAKLLQFIWRELPNNLTDRCQGMTYEDLSDKVFWRNHPLSFASGGLQRAGSTPVLQNQNARMGCGCCK